MGTKVGPVLQRPTLRVGREVRAGRGIGGDTLVGFSQINATLPEPWARPSQRAQREGEAGQIFFLVEQELLFVALGHGSTSIQL